MGKFSGTNLSARAYEGDDEASGDLFDHITGYNHEIRAVAGYYQARMVLLGLSDKEGDDWFDNGLNRRIVIRNPALEQIWEGFVNKVSIDEGDVVRTRGPITGIVNRVNVKYVKIDPTSTIPLVGVGDETGWVDESDSQDQYGIVGKVIDVGERSETEANQIANYYLAENAWPTRTTVIQSANAKPAVITLSLKGYWHWLLYPYNDTAGSGTETVSSKIQAVLTADPNSYISTDFSYIETNSTDVTHFEDRDRAASAVIQAMIMTSNNSFTRYTFGIYNDRIAHYTEIPSNLDPLYHYMRGSPTVIDRNGKDVAPWNLRPAQWVIEEGRRSRIGALLPDGLIASQPETSFIESVQFTAPYSFKLNGGKILSIDQSLARWGLGGTAI